MSSGKAARVAEAKALVHKFANMKPEDLAAFISEREGTDEERGVAVPKPMAPIFMKNPETTINTLQTIQDNGGQIVPLFQASASSAGVQPTEEVI